ncbi:hypothetical protein J7399_00135 [Shimia sp. R9_1]|uniref:hypothetical protein n=1 Tax=Shimia sp. R9_1 TaxID=2821111 RepID=UPI001ADC6F75|nr:hypothetical protein [Shimia sp. R9_1]MBO9405819.1 hypothetical protein [Shimia sp. R9_1]
MSQSTSNRKSIAALVVSALVFLVSLAGLGWGFVVSAILAGAAFFGMTMMSKSSSAAEAPEVSATLDPVVAPAPKPAAPVAEPEVAPAQDTQEAELETASAMAEAAPEADTETQVADPAVTAGMVKLGTLLPGEAELSERRGAWRYEG